MNDTREQTTKRTPPPIITDEDMRKILSVVTERLDAVEGRGTVGPGDNLAMAVWASFCTGMTAGEVCGLDGGDCVVTPMSRYGSVRAYEVMRDGGPREPQIRYVSGLNRTIVTGNAVAEAMRGHARRQRAKWTDRPWPVIARQADAPRDRWTRPASVSRAFRALCERAGLGRPYTFASLRRTHAAMLLRAGVPADVVAARLGAATPRRVARDYAAECAEGEGRRGEYDARLCQVLGEVDPLWGKYNAQGRAAWATFAAAAPTRALCGRSLG